MPDVLLIALSMTGKLGLTAAFHLIFVVTAELLPTHLRSLSVGEGSVCSRIGSVISPYINDLLVELLSH